LPEENAFRTVEAMATPSVDGSERSAPREEGESALSPDGEPPGSGLIQRAKTFAASHPSAALLLIVIVSNLMGSWFNIAYNERLIVRHQLTEAQRDVFWRVMVPAYNAVAYPIALGIAFLLMARVAWCLRKLRAGQAVEASEMEACRRRITRLPSYQVCLNLIAWLPGAVLFPLGICALGGWDNAAYIWLQFAVSFAISALLTTLQTFFLVESFLIAVLYPWFFRDARPAEARGTVLLSLVARVLLFWVAVAVAPLIALLAVVLNFSVERIERFGELRGLAVGVVVVGLPSSAFLVWMVGRNMLTWLRAHSAATRAIAAGERGVRIHEQRPDEWGELTDRFNDMAEALDGARRLRETFGQFVSPDVRDEILRRYPGIGGEVEEITVLFADIRGFTRRSAGLSPDRAVEFLNAFLSLAVGAVEEHGGWVNKFLGDGIMALFGAPRPRTDHADAALDAANALLARLDALNAGFAARSEEPLRVGVGIHTGPALVGCVGASIESPDGSVRVRREFTAIGDAVNVAQRIEQLTKTDGANIILSESTRSRLVRGHSTKPLGRRELPGLTGMEVHGAG
jgi:adenylate cyclase